MGFRDARINAGKSVREVMSHMNVSDVAIYNWESGINYPRPEKLLRLAEFYQCSVGDLLTGNPDPHISQQK
jgi:transcriptional regulator with XRE-family HTH domain